MSLEIDVNCRATIRALDSTKQKALRKHGCRIEDWCVGQVNDFNYLFGSIRDFAEILSQWDRVERDGHTVHFEFFTRVLVNASSWNVSRVIIVTHAFSNAKSFTPTDVVGLPCLDTREFISEAYVKAPVVQSRRIQH